MKGMQPMKPLWIGRESVSPLSLLTEWLICNCTLKTFACLVGLKDLSTNDVKVKHLLLTFKESQTNVGLRIEMKHETDGSTRSC